VTTREVSLDIVRCTGRNVQFFKREFLAGRWYPELPVIRNKSNPTKMLDSDR
jgi:hypothetical protein